jgi:hypothetical protein
MPFTENPSDRLESKQKSATPENHSGLAGVAAGAEHQLFASLIPPSGEV